MDVKIKVDGKEYEVGNELLVSISSDIPDRKEYMKLFQQLAGSEISEVRENIAYKDNINAETIKMLVKDKQVSVLRNLSSNGEASKKITEEELEYMYSTGDVEILCNIVGNIEGFELCDVMDIANKLKSHKDPKVRNALASDYDVPKNILRKLTKDADVDVAYNAKSSLE